MSYLDASTDALQRTMKEIEIAFFQYLEAYFVRRDLVAILDSLAPDVTCYGTGLDEASYEKESTGKLFLRDISQVPAPFSYCIDKLSVQPLSDDAGTVCCQMNIATEVENQKLSLNGLRLTMVFSRAAIGWSIRHKHISFPTSLHGEHESYPLKELEERNEALQRMVEEKTHSLEKALSEISMLAITDKLTGLFNRTKADEALDGEILRAKLYGRPFSVILMDIDHFKRVNDSHGHLEGDRVLCSFADLAAGVVRPTDLLCRWGGEEFLIICPETDLECASDLAEKIRVAVQNHSFDVSGKLTSSFGVALFRSEDTPTSLLLRADKAMYVAKESGRNCVVNDNILS